MNINQLICDLPIHFLNGDKSLPIDDICEDSRLATQGCLFIARTGTTTQGAAFIADAIQAGAVAILCEKIPDDAPQNLTWITAEKIDNKLTSQLAETFFGNPSHKLRLVGITGTNGKTTTAYLTRRLIRRSGVMCGMIGTIEIDDGIERTPATLTTPGCVELSKLFKRMVDNGCEAAVMEVSSHALDQDRTAAIDFHVGVFTNLTGDHLDYHGDMDSYSKAKAKLFESLGSTDWAILNADDPYSKQMQENCDARILHCHVNEEPAPPISDPTQVGESACHASMLQMTSNASRTQMTGPWGSIELTLPMIGKHNLYNTLQAIAAANAITSVARNLRTALEQSKGVPGRLEKVMVQSETPLPTVLVDYAHTHDALKNVLSAVKPLCQGKLITVFGCGGDRDATKRPKMAAIACQDSDIVIITSDNPRNENPSAIIADIQAGVPDDRLSQVQIIEDRKQAIEQAIQLATPMDTILIAGKGHEDYQISGSEKIHFDDREIAARFLKNHQSGECCNNH